MVCSRKDPEAARETVGCVEKPQSYYCCAWCFVPGWAGIELFNDY